MSELDDQIRFPLTIWEVKFILSYLTEDKRYNEPRDILIARMNQWLEEVGKWLEEVGE